MKVGFLDSGLGGLTILRAVTAALPQYDYVYYGDTAHLPYGDRDEEEVYQLTEAGARTLFAEGCVLIIVACNTASAETLRRMQDTFLKEEYPDRRILGVIVPTVEVVMGSGVRHALLLGTRRTVSSGKYEREFAAYGTALSVTSVATPKLVPLIEAGKLEQAINFATATVREILNKIPEIDACILGCTHYTILKEALRDHFPKVTFFSQDEIIPSKLASYLFDHPEIAQRIENTGLRLIKLTDPASSYDEIAAQLLGGTLVLEHS